MLQYVMELDGRILLFIQEYLRLDCLNPFVLFITKLGDAGIIWIALTAFLLTQKKYQKAGVSMAIALILGFIMTNMLFKNMIMRPRPFDTIPELYALVPVGGWSFPSGHSTSSIAAAVAMFWHVPRNMGISALVLGILICLSRLYVGVHYPTDVLFGALLGVLAAVCALWLTRKDKKDTKEIKIY
ncbi:MAG: phosphatase PAP2 family protein [Lachnospiraceae bacterium]